MIKKYILTFALLLALISVNSQTATNFSCNDCSGTHHDLFSVLDQGKVVIIVWVMPCGPCILPTKTAYNIYKSYQTSHPDKVLFYLCDDMADQTCSEIQAWATSNKFFDVPVFSDPSISMFDYGAPGMPKIAILGSSDYKIYNTQENSFNTQDILDAIELAIQETSDISDYSDWGFNCELLFDTNNGLNLLRITRNQHEVMNISLLNSLGQKIETVFKGSVNAGETEISISNFNLTAGMYIIKISTERSTFSKKITII